VSAPSFADRRAGAVLRGAPNFRDLGGLRSQDGRTVKHGLLFRSGHLGELHPEDVALLQARLGREVTVVDLRGLAEREKFACVLPAATVHSLPIEPSVAQRLTALSAAGEAMTPEITRRFMCEAYQGFVRNTGPRLSAFFGHVDALAGRPLVVHCAAGKDRTGFVAGVLLGALGVARDAVMEDYLLTNERVPPQDHGRFPPEIMAVLATVQAAFLQAAWDAIDADHGGLDAYLERVAGLTPARRQRLQAALLRAA
jgi:protein-tyrosine phosphatase